ncbi:MAG: PD-(D/E)XK nuclease family protein [Candidatus Methylomirabilia bacterium]
MPDLPNDFSWSRSRDSLFQECRRKYFYHYYGAWGGWEADVSEEVRTLYVLKQLSSRQQWAGKVVHEGVEWALRALYAGRELPESWLIEETVKRMRREWKASRDRLYWKSPKEAALFEHEYRIPVKDEDWQVLRDHVIRCLRNFYRLPLLAEIKRVPPDRWILIEEIRAFDFEETPMYGAPDFAYWTDAGRLALVDWKTGAPATDRNVLQLGCYALYAREVLRVEPARVDLLEVNLREGVVQPHPWDEAKLGGIREHLRLSIRGMRAWLRDPDANLAAEEDFEKTEDLRICRWCNFRGVCRSELVS